MISLNELGINILNNDGEVRKLADVQRDLEKAYSRFQEVKKPLLVIELENESAIPKVFYKGEEIKSKVHVHFEWDTATNLPGGLTYAIEHVEKGNGIPTVNRIERRVRGHATI